MANTFEGTRAYLVGRKVLLERNMEKLQGFKDAFELECIELMEKLDQVTKEGLEKYQSEIDKVKLSVDLHQGMLVALDTEHEIEDINSFNMETRKELNNLESVFTLTASRVKRLFTEKLNNSPQIVKRTVEVKAVVAPEKDPVIEQLFKKPFQYNPYPEEYYIRPNGYVNNQFVGERLHEYMVEHNGEMSIKEIGEWIREMFPKSVDRWASIEKGVSNVIQLHLRKNNLVEPIGNGVWKVKERA